MLFLHGIIEQIYELLPPPPQEKPKKHMDSSLDEIFGWVRQKNIELDWKFCGVRSKT